MAASCGCARPVSSPEEGLSRAAARVLAALAREGFDLEVRELPDSTRSAAEAAAAIGCAVAQIAKSLVFRAAHSGDALLVVASGTNQVDMTKLAALAGEPAGRADAKFVREQTGFAIGGIPPVGHDRKLATWIDRDLLACDVVWAAAGTPHAVFALPAAALVRLTGGTVADVRAD